MIQVDITGTTAVCAPDGSVWLPHVLRWWSLTGWVGWCFTPKRARLVWPGFDSHGRGVIIRLIRVAESHVHIPEYAREEPNDAVPEQRSEELLQ